MKFWVQCGELGGLVPTPAAASGSLVSWKFGCLTPRIWHFDPDHPLSAQGMCLRLSLVLRTGSPVTVSSLCRGHLLPYVLSRGRSCSLDGGALPTPGPSTLRAVLGCTFVGSRSWDRRGQRWTSMDTQRVRLSQDQKQVVKMP